MRNRSTFVVALLRIFWVCVIGMATFPAMGWAERLETDTTEVMPVVTQRLRDGIDTTVSPCADFDQFANGRWRAQQSRPIDAFYDLKDRIDDQLVTILDSARRHAATGSDPVITLVGQWYASCLRADTLRLRIPPTPGRSIASTRALQCLALTEERMQPALEYVFLRAAVTPAIATAMPTWLAQVRGAIRAQVQALSWVPDSTRTSALATLDSMQIRVQLAPDSQVYRGVVLDSMDFLANEATLRGVNERLAQDAKARAALIPRAERVTGPPVWVPYRVGAFAYWGGVSAPFIEIAPALFQAPFFDAQAEPAANFASLGMVIGHEMWHLLTPTFKWVDMVEARDRVSRLVDAYAVLTGTRWGTVNEDLADVGGLTASYAAWTAHGRANAVAETEGFNPAQRFFLYYARLWRGTHRKSRDGKHSAAFVRINGVLQQLSAFTEAFGCREGDAMFLPREKRAQVFEETFTDVVHPNVRDSTRPSATPPEPATDQGSERIPGRRKGPKDNIAPDEVIRFSRDTSQLTQRAIALRGLKPMQQVAHVLAEAKAAEAAGRLDVAAHQLAWASIATRTYTQRDSILARLHSLVQAGVWGPIKASQVEAVIDRVLDSLFQVIYDREVPVERAPAPASSRTVLGEYLTGVQCGVCWVHDRYFAALLQRYPVTQLVVIGYHDGPGFPIARTSDSLNKYIGQITDGTNTDNLDRVVYRDARGALDANKLSDWIDGVPRIKVYDLMSSITQKYQALAAAIDVRLQHPPGAMIDMTLAPRFAENRTGKAQGAKERTMSAIDVTVHVTPAERRTHLGVRLVLVQDTVRVTGYTPRRLHYMAARAVAWFGPKQLFYSLPANSTTSTTVSYTFDVAALQRELLQPYDVPGPDEDIRQGFPDRRDWMLDVSRLGVVAIVQDQDTREVLQTQYQSLRQVVRQQSASVFSVPIGSPLAPFASVRGGRGDVGGDVDGDIRRDSTSLDSTHPLLRPSLRYGLDTTVSPCTDFDRFANGGWRDSASLPPKVPSNDVFYFGSVRTAAFIQRLLDSTPALARTTKDPVLRAVGRYYESCLRADSLERSLAVLSMAGARQGDTSRAARCGRLVTRDLPDGAGQVFVNGLLPPQAEKRVRAMVANVQHAAEKRLEYSRWMTPQAKARVHKTLQTMTLRVARPEVVVDHSGLELTTDNFERNRQLIQEYLWKRQIVRTSEEAKALWRMNQYTANAQYLGGPNTIEVPAFMFQWPFFDLTGEDDAMGYAGAGMIIGHEMYHGITFSASATQDSGYLRLRDRLIAQYDSLPPIEGVSVNGKISVTENLPDLGGLLAAYDAWQAAGGAKNRTMVEGFTPEQRFFLHYARVWRAKQSSAHLRMLRSDPHAPHTARINGVVANVLAFAKAFGCREGDPMANSAAELVDIW